MSFYEKKYLKYKKKFFDLKGGKPDVRNFSLGDNVYQYNRSNPVNPVPIGVVVKIDNSLPDKLVISVYNPHTHETNNINITNTNHYDKHSTKNTKEKMTFINDYFQSKIGPGILGHNQQVYNEPAYSFNNRGLETVLQTIGTERVRFYPDDKLTEVRRCIENAIEGRETSQCAPSTALQAPFAALQAASAALQAPSAAVLPSPPPTRPVAAQQVPWYPIPDVSRPTSVGTLGPSINWDNSTETLRINKSDGTFLTLNRNDCFEIQPGTITTLYGDLPFTGRHAPRRIDRHEIGKVVGFRYHRESNPTEIFFRRWRAPDRNEWGNRYGVSIDVDLINSINRCSCPEGPVGVTYGDLPGVLPGQIIRPSLAEAALRQASTVRPDDVVRPGAAAILVPEIMPKAIEDKLELLKRFECKVCLVNVINTRLEQCGHTLCSICYDILPTPKECPICRASITKNQKLFFKKYLKK